MRLLQELKKIGHLVDAANRVPIRAWLAACVFHADRVSPLIGHCGFSGQRRYGMVQSAPSSTFPLFYSSSRNSASARSAISHIGALSRCRRLAARVKTGPLMTSVMR